MPNDQIDDPLSKFTGHSFCISQGHWLR